MHHLSTKPGQGSRLTEALIEPARRSSMRIDVKGRNLAVSDELRDHVAKRFRKVERQVSELASLELELIEERNPRVADSQVVEATLHVKGATLRARSASPDVIHSINLVSDELSRQVKRHRDKRRRRRESRAAAAAPAPGPTPVLDGEVVLEGGEVVLEAEVIPESEPLSGEGSAAS
jgi:putative sigma-54 modulation protein